MAITKAGYVVPRRIAEQIHTKKASQWTPHNWIRCFLSSLEGMRRSRCLSSTRVRFFWQHSWILEVGSWLMMATELVPGNEDELRMHSSPMHGYSNGGVVSVICSGKSTVPSLGAQSPLAAPEELSHASVHRRFVSRNTNTSHQRSHDQGRAELLQRPATGRPPPALCTGPAGEEGGGGSPLHDQRWRFPGD